ncbi:MAG: RNA methyltransferase [Candidatus Bathyarchaeota archaeon]
MARKKISIAIPASIVADAPHLREKTSKIGLIGRVAAIFRISEIIIYLDDPQVNQEADANLIEKVLIYMETPQYLRKKLFRIRSELRYVGILPPLRTPHHPLNRKMKNLRVGEYREGVTLTKKNSSHEDDLLVEIGVEKPALIKNARLPANKRVTIKVLKVNKNIEAELTSREQISEYWGYTVSRENLSFAELVKTKGFDLTIATSKYGTNFTDISDPVTRRLKHAEFILVAFGSPTQGLHKIVRQERVNLVDIVDFVINTVPRQGTETIRTEEALTATLAILNSKITGEH